MEKLNIDTHKTEVCGSSPQWPTFLFTKCQQRFASCSLDTVYHYVISTITNATTSRKKKNKAQPLFLTIGEMEG